MSGAHCARRTPERFSREAAAGYDRLVIENTRVVLAGCGALGQFVAMALALIGYPDAIFIDMDTFEESNMTRSPFYRDGAHKAKATAVGARAMCTAMGPITYRYTCDMVQRLGDALFRSGKKTIVIAAVDSVEARWWLAERCRMNGVPLIEAGFRGERWNLTVVPNGHTEEACWACDQQRATTHRLFSCTTYARGVMATGLIPATAPVAMSLAAWQVEAAAALLHGDARLAGCSLFGDLRTGQVQLMRRVCNPDCCLDHSIGYSKATRLACGPDNTVRDLLGEVAGHVPEPVIHLPASFIRTAPCVKCHGCTLVGQPEWQIHEAPCCTECGGSYVPAKELVPEQHGSLSGPTSESLFTTRLADLGVGPGLHLRVSGAEQSQIVRVSGGLGPFLTEAVPERVL